MNETKNRCGMPWSILYSKKLTENEKLVFIALKDRAYQFDKTCMKGFYCYIDWLAANLQMSDSTVKRAIKGLKEKKIIDAKRVKQHKKVVNLWTINWDIIDRANKQFKFAEIEYEEIDIIDEIMQEEIKTPCLQVEETTDKKPIHERVTELFNPIYQKLMEDNNTSNYGDALDNAINIVRDEYNSDRETVFELFKTELLKQKTAA